MPSRASLFTALTFSKECETNSSKEQKNTAVFANGIIWRKIVFILLTEVTAGSTTSIRHERNNYNSKCHEKVFLCRPDSGAKHFYELKPAPSLSPARHPAWLTTLCLAKQRMLSFQQELTNYIITKHLIKELLTDYLTKIFATIGSHFQINTKLWSYNSGGKIRVVYNFLHTFRSSMWKSGKNAQDKCKQPCGQWRRGAKAYSVT